MNKILRITGIVTALVAVLILGVLVTGVSAQGPSTPDLPAGTGQMQRGNGGGAGLGVRAVDEADMHAAIAGALGMSLEDFEAALAAGESPYTLALALGVDFADVRAAMDSLHAEALAQATAEGLITQERANRMQGRGAGGNNAAGGAGAGAGRMAGGAGNMAQGSGNQGGFGGDCLYQTP